MILALYFYNRYRICSTPQVQETRFLYAGPETGDSMLKTCFLLSVTQWMIFLLCWKKVCKVAFICQ